MSPSPPRAAAAAHGVPSGTRIKLALIGLLLAIIAALSLLVFVLVGDIFDFLTPRLRANLMDKAQHGVIELSHAAEPGLAANDAELAADAARSYASDRDVLLLVVRARGGRVLYRGGRDPGRAGDPFAGRPLAVADRPASFSAWAPVEIEGMRIGEVAMAVSKQPLEAGMQLRRKIAVVGAIGALVALLAALAFVNLYVGPLLRAIDEAFRKLEHTTETALESARLKSQFLANMSHEIRTPINGMLGITRLMLDSALPAKLRRYVEALEVSGRSLSTIINDVLDFSKIEAGKYGIVEADLDVASVTLDAAELLAESARQKGLDLVCRIDRSVPSLVRGDPDRFRQIVTNLAGNAVKFTSRGEVVISVSARPLDAGKVELRVEVADTGIGIADHAKSKVFEAFWQQDGASARSFGGTGLGLAISKRLVEAMGGSLSFESTVGEGSRFWLTLPAVLAPGSAGAAREPLAGRALIVDAGARWRELLVELLAAWGMRAEAVAGADAALAALRAAAAAGDAFAVAIVASRVEDAGAEALIARLVGAPETARLPLVYVSLLGEQPLPEALAAHVVAQLHKPLRLSQLNDALARALHGRAPRARGHSARSPAARALLPLLLVEDNEINELVATEQLAELGYDVDVARNGAQAVEAVSKRRYGAVLMDCQMPVMDGYQACREIRSREQPGQHLPIIALTAHALAGEREKVLAAGMDDYLTKPVRPESLHKMLARHLPAEARAGAPPLAPRAKHDAAEDDLDASMPRSREVVELFLELVPAQIDELAHAIRAGSAGDARAHAHKVKGSGLSIGARRFARTASELQLIAEAGRLSLAPEKLDELRARFERVRVKLAAELG